MLPAARVLAVSGQRHRLRWIDAVLLGAGYETLAAATGREALRAAYAARPALVVLETSTQDPGAWDMLARLRSFSSVPVLMLLTWPQPGDQRRAWLAGADDWISGKLDGERLLLRVPLLAQRRSEA